MSSQLLPALVIAGVTLSTSTLVAHALIRSGWNELTSRFPARERLDPAVRREFQSISIDLFNFGMCVHTIADERCLHVEPALFLRLVGARATASIPWDALTLTKAGRRITTVRAGSVTLKLPAWCAPLVQPPPTAGPVGR